ncbi:hypothetical protein SCOCK_180174 [Actinacidiphila cocklensis]|uniref:Uncharacterized protein n=1 Tax=Actinacidiphila cocklensis TaxID=887465 RepID=A0A9W4DMD9_9ACTN|nr:hypothetical protein SCOCK_180174 [Actinacidiphila cocklensis]
MPWRAPLVSCFHGLAPRSGAGDVPSRVHRRRTHGGKLGCKLVLVAGGRKGPLPSVEVRPPCAPTCGAGSRVPRGWQARGMATPEGARHGDLTRTGDRRYGTLPGDR